MRFPLAPVVAALCPPQTIIDLQLENSDVVSSAHDKCVIREADDARSSRQVHAQENVLHDVPNEWIHLRPLKGATCHLFHERPFVALVYHPPVAQIVIYHSKQVVWNLFRTIASMQMFHLAVSNALRMSMPINAQNPLRLQVPLLAFVAMSTTAWMASTVDLPFLKPNWFSERPFSRTM